LYVLNEKRVWDDRGTGHVSCTVSEKLGGTTLVVQSETDGKRSIPILVYVFVDETTILYVVQVQDCWRVKSRWTRHTRNSRLVW